MNGITKMAVKAAEDYKVSEQNREVWSAGYLAGFIKGRAYGYRVVAESCTELSASLEAQIKSETTEE